MVNYHTLKLLAYCSIFFWVRFFLPLALILQAAGSNPSVASLRGLPCPMLSSVSCRAASLFVVRHRIDLASTRRGCRGGNVYMILGDVRI